MKKMTFNEVYETFYRHNEENGVDSQFSDKSRITAVVVFSKDNWTTDYSEKARSYRFASDNKYFVPGIGGNSIFGDCLDGSENGVRLDYYLREWKVDHCYIEEK